MRVIERPCVPRVARQQLRELATAVAEHSVWGAIRLPAHGVHPVDAIADDVARTLEQRHPPKPVEARALCDVHSTRGFLAVMVVHERLESGASLVTAHGTARTGDVAKVFLRNRQLQSTGRLSSATGGDWRLLQSWENNCLWTHVRGLIWFAVLWKCKRMIEPSARRNSKKCVPCPSVLE